MTDRNRKLNDYNEQLRLLDERFENALNRRKETFERSAAEEKEDAAAALRRKYVENRFAVKRLPQVAARRVFPAERCVPPFAAAPRITKRGAKI